MSTRECSRCGGTCHGCDNQDEPHVCERCAEEEKKMKANDLSGLESVIFAVAKAEADEFSHDYIGTEHLLLAVAKAAPWYLTWCKPDVSIDRVKKGVADRVQFGPTKTAASIKPFTPRSKRAIEFAREEAASQGHALLTPADLLVGLVKEAEGVAADVLREIGVSAADLRDAGAAYDRSRDMRLSARLVVEGADDAPCDHATKFKEELRALYARNKDFVTLDDPIKVHCHVCSGVYKIPSDLMRPNAKEKAAKKPQVVITKFRVVTSVNVPDYSDAKRVTLSHVAVELDPSVTLWLLSAQDDVGEWKETYATEIEKNAFVRGFRAASAMHGNHDPVVVEIQKP